MLVLLSIWSVGAAQAQSMVTCGESSPTYSNVATAMQGIPIDRWSAREDCGLDPKDLSSIPDLAAWVDTKISDTVSTCEADALSAPPDVVAYECEPGCSPSPDDTTAVELAYTVPLTSGLTWLQVPPPQDICVATVSEVVSGDPSEGCWVDVECALECEASWDATLTCRD